MPQPNAQPQISEVKNLGNNPFSCRSGSCVATGFLHIIDHGSNSSRIHNEFGQVRGVPRQLPHASGRILLHHLVDVPQAMQDPGEDFGLDHHLRQVHGMLGDLRQTCADLQRSMLFWGFWTDFGQACRFKPTSLLDTSCTTFFWVIFCQPNTADFVAASPSP